MPTTVVGLGCGVGGRFSATGRDDALDAGFAAVGLRAAVLFAFEAVAGLGADGRGLVAVVVAAGRVFFAGLVVALRAVVEAGLRALVDAGFDARLAGDAFFTAFFTAAGFFAAFDVTERVAFFTAGLRTAVFFAVADFFATAFFATATDVRFFVFAGSAVFLTTGFFAAADLLAGRLVAGLAAARLLAADGVLRTGVLAMNGLLQWVDARASRTRAVRNLHANG